MSSFSRVLFFFAAYLLVFPMIIFAHPGRTASDGCHYCRTNCSSWGEVENARHCHGGGSAPIQEPVIDQQIVLTNTPRPVVPTSVPTKIPTNTPRPATPTLVPTITKTPTPTNTSSSSPAPTLNPTTTNPPQVMGTNDTDQELKTGDNDGSTMGGLLLAVVVYGGYKLVKKFKKTKNYPSNMGDTT